VEIDCAAPTVGCGLAAGTAAFVSAKSREKDSDSPTFVPSAESLLPVFVSTCDTENVACPGASPLEGTIAPQK